MGKTKRLLHKETNYRNKNINKGNNTMAHTLLMMAMDSVDKKRGYLTSSFTILSNTSSSSSPGNGD